MEGRIHGSARTTPRIRAELQASKESNRKLAALYRLNVKTVAKWRARTTMQDARMGPANPRSANLTASEEAMVVEFRRRTMMPLDNRLGHLLDYFPQLTRSALHRCLVRHGVSQAPKSAGAAKRGKFDKTEMGYLHIDSSELRLETGKQHLFVAVDRVTKFTCAAFFNAATKRNGAEFLRQVVQAFPYKIHTVLTDNDAAFTEQARYRNGATNRFGGHIFDRVCYDHGIKHRLTKAYHPWTNGQVERMNRTIKDATIKAFHYPDFAALKAHVLAFITAYNFAKHLKALRWRTPFKVICEAWTINPERFTTNPHHLIPGPYT
ncbi:IS481 family transposase [Pseudomonas sp. UBA6562]|uniref:IS481 family transposase n=1 Tax=Pseudomonas sp. UBA6562 TaxID=1947332 RepID=UPI002600087D|nr:IS481 family transposase [Pseudomonas sp. UBA6562]